MTICKLFEMPNVPSGLLLKVESATREQASDDVLRWLGDFYRGQSKKLDTDHPRTITPYKKGYPVREADRVITKVKVAYMGNDTRTMMGRVVRFHQHGVFFDNPDGSPNTADKANFIDYFKTRVLEQPQPSARYSPPTTRVS